MILGIWARLSKQASIYPAVQNMLLAARALYLGATLTTLYLQFETESGGRSRLAARRPLICPAADRLPHGTVWASTPHRALRCRLRGSVGRSLTGICSDGKPGMCCSDRRLLEVAKNSHAAYWLILTSYHGYRSYALDDKSSRCDGLFTGIVTIMRRSMKYAESRTTSQKIN